MLFLPDAMMLSFQSTLPRRERPVVASLPDLYNYFNPRSREGSDLTEVYILYNLTISIHAPAKGATKDDKEVMLGIYISIHAPAKGATLLLRLPQPRTQHFNPRSREGSDEDGKRRIIAGHNFNPRSREGSDPDAMMLSKTERTFQSTLPRRERQRYLVQLGNGNFNFNPRSREGSDYGWEVSTVKEYISIHAPAKGATVEDVQDLKQSIISIHAPAKGATST